MALNYALDISMTFPITELTVTVNPAFYCEERVNQSLYLSNGLFDLDSVLSVGLLTVNQSQNK